MDREELLAAAEEIYMGWFRGVRIDWDDFLYRLEEQTGHDLGGSMLSDEIRAIKKHIYAYRLDTQ